MPVPSAHGEVPEGFDRWFARAASREPGQRYRSAGEMAEALRAILAPAGVGESAIATLATSHSNLDRVLPPKGTSEEAWSTGQSETAKRATPTALLAGLLLAPLAVVLVGSGMWIAARRPQVELIAMTTADPVTSATGNAAPPEAPPPLAPSAVPSTRSTMGAPQSSAAKPAPPRARRGAGQKPQVDLGI
jgi:serine/threonine-protein kinase